jgi:hypothetical protein
MKADDSVESLVHFLVHSVTPAWLVKAAKGHHGIGCDNSGCGVNYHDPNDPDSPNNRPGRAISSRREVPTRRNRATGLLSMASTVARLSLRSQPVSALGIPPKTGRFRGFF